jgi:hypothetical protein
MASFTMPNQVYANPAGTIDINLGYALLTASGSTIKATWSCTGSISFTGMFRRRDTGATFGPQGFVSNTGGNWIWTASGTPFDGNTPIGFLITSISGGSGKTITISFNTNNGENWSGRWVRRSGIWVFAPVFTSRSGAWVFSPRQIRRSGLWVYSHKGVNGS